MKKLLSLLLLVAALAACKKQETEPPVVTILSPAEADSFFMSDSVPLNFTITDDNLTGYKIIVSNYLNRKLYYKEEGIAAGNSVTVDKKIFFSIEADTTVLMNILGIDKNGNTGGAGVKFTVKK